MKKVMTIIALGCAISIPTITLANEAQAPCGKPTVINVEVNGLVCDFCARAVEKVFGKRDDITSVKVDLDAGNIALGTNDDSTLTEDVLRTLITDSGYDVVGVQRECS